LRLVREELFFNDSLHQVDIPKLAARAMRSLASCKWD
jgi:hypothetical protein